MKIMSFNTQHCQNFKTLNIDFAVMADAIRACGADIVGLNEMYDEGPLPQFTPQVRTLSELTGLEHCYFAKAIDVEGNNPYGNGLLSHYPIASAEVIPVPDPEDRVEGKMFETRCLLKVTLENGYTVLVIHFGLNSSEQKNAAAVVEANLKAEKCILMGDFNVVPEDAVLAPIRAKMKDTADLFAKPLLSYPSDQPEIKIDYIFVSPDVEVVSADIPAIVASDHRPHTAELL